MNPNLIISSGLDHKVVLWNLDLIDVAVRVFDVHEVLNSLVFI